ncbi:nucleotidyl transferase AbiEii/AbiGii toxin family protein [Undibacterium sp. Di26W]|uniref:nucleotidyl transferase AbiEii/AbiGii toxin family protein n=1 Tax=Undibacterium sp. Di26W TaxID=3413035 RepID=UPI003BF16D94
MAGLMIWEDLFKKSLTLIDEIETHGTKNLYWTFGGGTVLMRRYQHRFSKDIDIFVPDPQALKYVTPRLSDQAESITTEYTEADNYVKLFLSNGEIDFVASPNLTDSPFVFEEIFGRQVRVETSAEIIAKKFFHRGDRLQARDMFDFALVAEKEPVGLLAASKFLVRHAKTINTILNGDTSFLRKQFNAIDTIDYKPTFDYVRELVLGQLVECANYLEANQ